MAATSSLFSRSLAPVIREALTDTPVVCLVGPRQSGRPRLFSNWRLTGLSLAWTNPDLRFWHYRDKDQVEVDLVMTRGQRTWGTEVKAAGAFTSGDGCGLIRLADC